MTESEENDIQRLIRLKRYEQPPEGFVDDFMIRFHHRQRAEILNQSSFGLFWDRVSAFMTGRMTPASGVAYAVTAVVVVGGAVVLLPHGGSTVTVAEAAKPAPAVAKVDNSFVASPELGFAPEDHQLSLPSSQLAQLMSQHFGGVAARSSRACKVSRVSRRSIRAALILFTARMASAPCRCLPFPNRCPSRGATPRPTCSSGTSSPVTP